MLGKLIEVEPMGYNNILYITTGDPRACIEKALDFTVPAFSWRHRQRRGPPSSPVRPELKQKRIQVFALDRF